MSAYVYKARREDGSLANGQVDMLNIAEVASYLRSRALYPVDIVPASKAQARLALPSRVKPDALAAFFRSFALLTESNVPPKRALEICAKRESDQTLKEALAGVIDDVSQGTPIAEAMGKRPVEFPRQYTAMIQAGEEGGILPDASQRLAEIVERDRAVAKKIKSALSYPSFVFTFAIIMVWAILWKIVPMFSTMFHSFGVKVSGPTAVVFAVSSWLSIWWVYLVIAAVVGLTYALLTRYARTERGALQIERLLSRIPKVGLLIQKRATASVMRMLGMLMLSSVHLKDALPIAAPVSPSKLIGNGLVVARSQVLSGTSFEAALTSADVFDDLVLQLVAVGEASGSLPKMLLKIAEYFDLDVDLLIAELLALLEPALIIVLGGMVGLIVFSVYIPLYQLVSSVH